MVAAQRYLTFRCDPLKLFHREPCGFYNGSLCFQQEQIAGKPRITSVKFFGAESFGYAVQP